MNDAERADFPARSAFYCARIVKEWIYAYDEPIANPNGDWIRGFTPAVISQKTADLIFKEKGIQASSLRAGK